MGTGSSSTQDKNPSKSCNVRMKKNTMYRSVGIIECEQKKQAPCPGIERRVRFRNVGTTAIERCQAVIIEVDQLDVE
jgi:hypothetical protein